MDDDQKLSTLEGTVRRVAGLSESLIARIEALEVALEARRGDTLRWQDELTALGRRVDQRLATSEAAMKDAVSRAETAYDRARNALGAMRRADSRQAELQAAEQPASGFQSNYSATPPQEAQKPPGAVTDREGRVVAV